MMVKATCSTCPNFYPEDAHYYDHCRRAPRVAVERASPGGSGFGFPRAESTEWCGEHPDRQGDRIAEVALGGLLANTRVLADREHIARDAHTIAEVFLAERARRAGATA